MLEQYVTLYVNELRLIKSPHTFYNYKKHLEKFEKWVKENNVDFKNISTKSLRRFRDWLVSQNLSPRSINTILSAVKSFYDFLVDEEVVQGNPIVMSRLRVPESHSKPKFLSESELKTVLKEIEKLPKHVALAFKTMLYAGLRVSEVANLTAQDVLLMNNKVYIHVQQGKGKKERYAIVVNENTAKELIEKAKSASGSLFNVKATTLKSYAYTIKKKTGVDFHSHRLRHTFATSILNKGAPIEVVQKALGHSNISTTRIYAETLPETLEKFTVSISDKEEKDDKDI